MSSGVAPPCRRRQHEEGLPAGAVGANVAGARRRSTAAGKHYSFIQYHYTLCMNGPAP